MRALARGRQETLESIQTHSTRGARLIVRTVVNPAKQAGTKDWTRKEPLEDCMDVVVKRRRDVGGSSAAIDLVLNRIEAEAAYQSALLERVGHICHDVVDKYLGSEGYQLQLQTEWARVCRR